MDADNALAWVERKLGATLAAGQRAAVTTALGTKLAIITTNQIKVGRLTDELGRDFQLNDAYVRSA